MGHEPLMGEVRNTHKILSRKPQGNLYMYKLQENIKIVPKK
jgi:hypothetical protein